MTLPIFVVLVALAAAAVGEDVVDEYADGLDDKINQMVWKNCVVQLTPTCIKLYLARMVDRLSEDTNLQPLPGILLVANRSRSLTSASKESLPPMQRIDGYLIQKIIGYFRSLTMRINFTDLPSFNTTGVFDGMLTQVTGRKKSNNNGILALAMMLGGALMTMMMSMVAAMAGKALMTSMMALMLAAMGAMKGHGGGGGKSTTYEIIAQPEVSHAHSHSSEVQHGHWKRSVDANWPFFAVAS